MSAQTLFGMEQEQTTSDDYYTPAWVFERMGITFDLDVCSPPGGLPWIPAKQFYTMADDGLAQPWTGRVWMNPPFSRMAPWVDKFIHHSQGACLVQVSRSRSFYDLWCAADALTLVDTTMTFVRPGHAANRDLHPYMPVVFAAFGDECVDAISRLGVVRKATP